MYSFFAKTVNQCCHYPTLREGSLCLVMTSVSNLDTNAHRCLTVNRAGLFFFHGALRPQKAQGLSGTVDGGMLSYCQECSYHVRFGALIITHIRTVSLLLTVAGNRGGQQMCSRFRKNGHCTQ